jgi:hypothetical protein
MNRKGNVATAAVLSVLACFVAVSARSQTRPNAPPQICVNGQCATTPVTTPVPPSGSGKIKWNPGHYMASYGVVYGGAGRPTSFMQAEADDLNNQDAIVGYRMMITWGALETSQGTYDFSAIDTILARLKTAYNKPKHLVIMLWDYGRNGPNHADPSVFPVYIQQNPIYGASPVAGSYGWWGQSSNGTATGMYAPALYYAPVMDRYIALVQALGQHLDGDPYVEAIFFQENSTIVQAATYSPKDGHYSDAAILAQSERLLNAATAAFPHTSVVMGNSWLYGQSATVALEQWMQTNRIATGSADSFGQSSINASGTKILSWSLRAYVGDPGFGGVDMRPTMTAMMDVESGDINDSFQGLGGPWAAPDIIQAMNQTYHASHVFWTRLVGSGVRPQAQWPTVAAACAATPIARTAYPANYP